MFRSNTLFDFVFRRKEIRMVDDLANQIARHCAAAVRVAVPSPALLRFAGESAGEGCFAFLGDTRANDRMPSGALLRGYWRARARAVIIEYGRHIESERCWPTAVIEAAIAASLERVVATAADLPGAESEAIPLAAAA